MKYNDPVSNRRSAICEATIARVSDVARRSLAERACLLLTAVFSLAAGACAPHGAAPPAAQLNDAAAVETAAARSLPNIVFIMADDLGWADLSSYGRSDYETPRIDRLATRGVRFTNAYSIAPLCTPTRVGFMTGRYTDRHPIGRLGALTTERSPTGAYR